MKKITYKTSGTCSSEIEIELDGEKIESVVFKGGCNGNTNGLSALLKGMSAKEAVDKLSGIRCGFKATSCPDQLARALKKELEAK